MQAGWIQKYFQQSDINVQNLELKHFKSSEMLNQVQSETDIMWMRKWSLKVQNVEQLEQRIKGFKKSSVV